MHESALPDEKHENHGDIRAREGILFAAYTRPRSSGRREQAVFKVKSIPEGTEYELGRTQKRINLSTSGAPISTEGAASNIISGGSSVIRCSASGDTKKQRKHVKQLFLDQTFETGVQLKNSVQSGLPIIAVDVPLLLFDAMTRSGSWITDEEAWKIVLKRFQLKIPPMPGRSARQLPSDARRHRFLILFA
ncbi:hypothetical protein AX14_013772, partial [Amanita brunnescens Koide BX004]